MKSGEVAVEGGLKQNRARLRLGFGCEDFGYAISLGYPIPSSSAFSLDPEIKQETIWAGDCFRRAAILIQRDASVVKARQGRQWDILTQHAHHFESLFSQVADPVKTPEVFSLRERIRQWRFYDHFRTDADAPARQPQLATRTPVLSSDGSDLAAAIQTIIEIGDKIALSQSIDDAFPGSELRVVKSGNGRFSLELHQPGLLRPLSGNELSDGTLRYLLWIAALLTPRPPALMVLNEPETSLHPDLLPALARLIIKASEATQVWVVSHASRLIAALEKAGDCHSIALDKNLGETHVMGQGVLDAPAWHWPDKCA
jgi:predicted ATPase